MKKETDCPDSSFFLLNKLTIHRQEAALNIFRQGFRRNLQWPFQDMPVGLLEAGFLLHLKEQSIEAAL